MLNREAILSKKNLKKQKVTVPEWGGDVFVSEMTAEARDEWEQKIIRKDDGSHLKNFRAKLVVACLVDEKGNRIFGDGDVEEVGRLSAKALGRVVEVAQKVNGLTDKDLEDVEGNLDAAPSGNSTSD